MRSYTELAQMQKSASYETIRKVASLIKSAKPAPFMTLSGTQRTQPDVRQKGVEDRFKAITGREPVVRRVSNWLPAEDRYADAAPGSAAEKLKSFLGQAGISAYADSFKLHDPGPRRLGRTDRQRALENTARLQHQASRTGAGSWASTQETDDIADYAAAVTRENIARQRGQKIPLTSYKDLFVPNGRLRPQKDLKLESDRKARRILDKYRTWDYKRNKRTVDPRWERVINKGKIFGNYKKPGTSNTAVV